MLENPAQTAPIGTGPCKFVQYERGQSSIAERNANYWRKGEPSLKSPDTPSRGRRWWRGRCTTGGETGGIERQACRHRNHWRCRGSTPRMRAALFLSRAPSNRRPSPANIHTGGSGTAMARSEVTWTEFGL